MANTIIHKRSSTASAVPTAGSLSLGELAINTTDGKVYLKKGDGSVVEVSSNSNHSHSAADITSGTLANARTTAVSTNDASTIVLRDAAKGFSCTAISGGNQGLTLSGSVKILDSAVFAAGTLRSGYYIGSSDGNIQTVTGTTSGTQYGYAVRYDGTGGSATTVIFTNGGLMSGSTAFWHPTILFPGGVKPTLSSSGIDVITFLNDGTNNLAFVGGLAFA